MSLDACTIVSKNYLAFARVLARSFLEHHPGGRFFVLLVDRIDGAFDPAAEPFEVIEVESLDNVPRLRELLFKYTLLEANTAVKPFFLEHLFATHRPERLLYLDPDIRVYRRLEPLEELLASHRVALTPHLTSPVEDGLRPSELDILQAGSYNLGFLGLAASGEARELLAWWRERVYDQCVVRIDRGLFVDQKWIDLVPGLWEGVAVARHPGLNVAYWNLHGRRVTRDGETEADEPGGGFRVDGEPLYFFHFSGIQLEALELVSKHQDRFRLGDLGPAVAELYRGYRDAVLAEGHETAAGWPYAFARFDDGTPIPDLARSLYHAQGKARARFGDPFSTGPGSFYEWLDAPHPVARHRRGEPPYLSHLLHHLHASRPDLVRRFPRPGREELGEFTEWMHDFGRHDYSLPEPFLAPLGAPAEPPPAWTPAGMKRRAKTAAKTLLDTRAGRAGKRRLKQLLGDARTREVKRRLGRPVDTAGPGAAVAAAAGRSGPRGRLELPAALERPGINLIGYLASETGMGEGARGLLAALRTAGIPVAPHTLDLNVRSRQGETAYAGLDSGLPYDVNLLFVNADQVEPVVDHLGAETLSGRYNVGLWLWELETFPEGWRSAFAPFHEIWTPSTFCAEAISELSPLPVRRVPLPVTTPADLPDPAATRRRHGIPDGAFAVLSTFDFLSYWERKNPLAAVAAFRRAFGKGDREAVLVLKTSSSDFSPEGRERMERAVEPLGERVVWIDGYLDRGDVWGLVAAADAYVSLHRSEGYGLTIAEAMALGKPVVATPYSGNRDFFDERTGFPVAWELVPVERDAGPYRAGARWAEPDVADAARLLRRLVDDPETAARRAERGRREIETRLSPEAVGAILRKRFQEILQLTNSLQGHKMI